METIVIDDDESEWALAHIAEIDGELQFWIYPAQEAWPTKYQCPASTP